MSLRGLSSDLTLADRNYLRKRENKYLPIENELVLFLLMTRWSFSLYYGVLTTNTRAEQPSRSLSASFLGSYLTTSLCCLQFYVPTGTAVGRNFYIYPSTVESFF